MTHPPVSSSWSGDYIRLQFQPAQIGGVLASAYGARGIAAERDMIAKKYHDAIIAEINERFPPAKEC